MREKYLVVSAESLGKGLSKDLMVWSKNQPEKALKISSRPMKTMTLVITGAFSIGFRMMRCTSSPPAKDTATVKKNAPQ